MEYCKCGSLAKEECMCAYFDNEADYETPPWELFPDELVDKDWEWGEVDERDQEEEHSVEESGTTSSQRLRWY